MSILEDILTTLTSTSTVGTTGLQLDQMAGMLLDLNHCEPAFLGYQPHGFKEPYPARICVSLNGEVIHGIPDERKFQDGDVIKLDIGLKDKDGQFDDGATTFIVGGKGSSTARRLLAATQEALAAGIAAAKPGNSTNDIARAIESVARREEFSVIHGYGGHGIGTELHMDPFIPNEVSKDLEEVILVKGMRIAIEPMFATKKGYTEIASNGWTIQLKGGGVAAHFEKTITI
jgi:methionyl aminopeptidase